MAPREMKSIGEIERRQLYRDFIPEPEGGIGYQIGTEYAEPLETVASRCQGDKLYDLSAESARKVKRFADDFSSNFCSLFRLLQSYDIQY
jgi:hypothetical protein